MFCLLSMATTTTVFAVAGYLANHPSVQRYTASCLHSYLKHQTFALSSVYIYPTQILTISVTKMSHCPGLPDLDTGLQKIFRTENSGAVFYAQISQYI